MGAPRRAGPTAEQMAAFTYLKAQVRQQSDRARQLNETGGPSSQAQTRRAFSAASPVVLGPFDSTLQRPVRSEHERASGGLPRQIDVRTPEGPGLPTYGRTEPQTYTTRHEGIPSWDTRGRAPVPPTAIPSTPFGTVGTLEPGIEPSTSLLTEFRNVIDYRLYRLEDMSQFFSEHDAGRIGKYVNRCRRIRPTMANFDGSNPIELLPFLKDVRITFNAQHLNESAVARVIAHFLERDAERLYTSFTMSAIRGAGFRTSHSITWPGLVNALIRRYLTDDVLDAAYRDVHEIRQSPHETENVYADRLEQLAYSCTAVFTDAAMVNVFVRGLAPETRDVVAETVQRLPLHERAELSVVRRIALAEGNTYMARQGKPLPDVGARAQFTPRPTKPVPSSTTGSSTLFIDNTRRNFGLIAGNAGLHDAPPDYRFDPVLVTSGQTALASPSTDSYDTALATGARGQPTSADVSEVDITERIARFVPASVLQLIEEQVRLARSIMPTNSTQYRCWLCRLVGHTLYTCPLLTAGQQLYAAYQNYQYQLETRPGMRNLLTQAPRAYEANRGRNTRFADAGRPAQRRNSNGYRSAYTPFPRPDQRGRGGRRPPAGDVEGAMMYLRDLVTSEFAERAPEAHVPTEVLATRDNVDTQRRDERIMVAPPGMGDATGADTGPIVDPHREARRPAVASSSSGSSGDSSTPGKE